MFKVKAFIVCVLAMMVALSGCGKTDTQQRELTAETTTASADKMEKVAVDSYQAEVALADIEVDKAKKTEESAIQVENIEEVPQIDEEMIGDEVAVVYEDEVTNEEEELFEPIPTEEEMIEDLYEEGVNSFVLNHQVEDLEVTRFEIEKRKTRDGQDEAHINVDFENEYYIVSAQMVLYYSYYDIGGWCLDYCAFVEFPSNAKKSPVSDAYFVEYMLAYFDDCYILARYESQDAAGNFVDTVYFDATIEFPYTTTMVSGEYTMTFSDNCWNDTCYLYVAGYDFGDYIGSFTYRNPSANMGVSFYSVELNVNIEDVVQMTADTVSITYSGSTYLYDTSLELLEVNESVESTTKEVNVEFESINVLGTEIMIPAYFGGINLPWVGTSRVHVHCSYEEGVLATDTIFNGSTEHFVKDISDEELQDAWSELQSLN